MSIHRHSDTTEIKICRITRTMGQFSLLWPDDDEELNPGIRYKFKLAGFVLLTGIMSALNTIHLYMTVKGKLLPPHSIQNFIYFFRS